MSNFVAGKTVLSVVQGLVTLQFGEGQQLKSRSNHLQTQLMFKSTVIKSTQLLKNQSQGLIPNYMSRKLNFSKPVIKLTVFDRNLEVLKTIGEDLDESLFGLEITVKYIAHDGFGGKVTVYLKNGATHLVK